jgi:Ran GTPase-activating protein (RanGAP) involved in mRNA processing and transport
MAVTTTQSGLKKKTTPQELTLRFCGSATIVSPILASLRDHPLLLLFGDGVDLTGVETVLQSDTSKITELEMHGSYGGSPIMGMPFVLQALARRPKLNLTKLAIRCCTLDRDEARLLRLALCSIPSLHSLLLTEGTLVSAGLAGLASALYRNTSIKVLDMSSNRLGGMESAEIRRDDLRRNMTITTLGLSDNTFGQTTSAVECIADGLGRNATLLKIDLSGCALGDVGITIFGASARQSEHNPAETHSRYEFNYIYGL